MATTPTQATPQATQVVKKTETPITEMVLSRVTQLQEANSIDLPKDYSASNAVRSAYLIISDMKDAKTGVPITQVCTRDSIINAMFNMVSQGLSPQKRQCSFIQYGNKLHLQREYAGSVALAKRYGNLKDIHAQVIYEGDEAEFEIDTTTGRRKITKHVQKLENINLEKIKGAYAVIVFNDGTTDVEVMTMAQIRKAWEQGSTKGASPAHKNFTDQMAMKSVINRACKLLIATSDDSVLMEPGEDGRIPRQALSAMSADHPMPVAEEPIQEPQVIDIPDAEPVQETAPQSREWKQPETDKAPF